VRCAEELRQIGRGPKLLEHGQVNRDARRPIATDHGLRLTARRNDEAEASEQRDALPRAAVLAGSKVRAAWSEVGHDCDIHPNSARKNLAYSKRGRTATMALLQ
jgi:hypothetical protein